MSDRPPGAPGKLSSKEARRLWNAYQARQASGPAAAGLRIGIAASFTADTLVPFIGAHLVAENLAPAFAIGPYNQLFQACLAPQAAFGGPCDVVVLLWRIEDMMLEEIAAFLQGDTAALASAADKAAALAAAIGQLRENFAGMIVAGIPPLPAATCASPDSLDHAVGLGAFHRAVIAKFVDRIAAIGGVRLLDLDAVQRRVGLAAAHDSRQWYLYRAPFSDAFLHEAGVTLGRIIVASRRAPKKCVVLDCDNTLWGGVIGEDGIDGIYVGDDFPGSAYRDLQRLVLHWRSQGVLVALLSKNNEADVWEVFDRHDAMVLKRSHVSAWQIDWQPKAENIPLIAKALNIGIDSLVFIDDSPMEVAYMREAQPEVTSILLPEDPAEIVTALHGLTVFDRLEVTQEDRQRADMMRAELDREQLSTRVSKDEFLRALELEFELFLAQSEDLGRITQLINKTNQFNLTTIRRTLDEIRALARSPRHRLYGLRVSDRFGEYGLTGAVIVEVSDDRRTWMIETLLLSCRVLGRGVEASLLAALAEDARAEGASEFVASFLPTAKNALCATFLPDHGFQPDGDQRWRLSIGAAPALADFVTRAGTANAGSRAA